MPTPITDILAEADRLLEPARFQDYGPNGLQVPGPDEVATIVTGVSAHAELFERATAENADLILVHHGLFWGSGAGPIDVAMKRRLQLLFDSDIALAAYHLPLDAHPEIGNNALIAHALGAVRLRPFAVHRGEHIGFLATLPGEGMTAAGETGLFSRVQELTGREPLLLSHGPTVVRSVAIVSGAGTDHLAEAIAEGADAFITGEPAERAMAQAAEGGIHFIAAGHHATETFGIKRLGEHLGQRFGLRHVFIDVRNPI
jgi:dinuclear metal center YbgI/SA1388 family protein